MIDIGRKDSPSGGNLVAYKFGRDLARNNSSERLTLLGAIARPDLIDQLIFADGHELHLRRHDPLTGVVELRGTAVLGGTGTRAHMLVTQLFERSVRLPYPSVFGAEPFEPHRIAPILYPLLAYLRYASVQIHFIGGIGIGATGIVYDYIFVFLTFAVLQYGVGHSDAPHRYAQEGETLSFDIDFLTAGQRAGSHFEFFHINRVMGLGFYCFETIALKLKAHRSASVGGLDDQDLIVFGQTEIRP